MYSIIKSFIICIYDSNVKLNFFVFAVNTYSLRIIKRAILNMTGSYAVGVDLTVAEKIYVLLIECQRNEYVYSLTRLGAIFRKYTKKNLLVFQ